MTTFRLEKCRLPMFTISNALSRMSIEQLSYCCENSRRSVLVPHVVSSGVKANDLGAYFMRFLTTLWNILYVSIFRSLSCDDEEALNKLQDMDSQL